MSDRYAAPGNRRAFTYSHLQSPTAELVLDLVTQESLYGRVQATADFFINQTGIGPAKLDEDCLIMRNVPVHEIGPGLSMADVPKAPMYRKAVSRAITRLGHDSDSFLVHRVHIEYPIVLSRCVLGFQLPHPPDMEK